MIEIERAAVGKEVIKQRAAGDASFVTNPDGTRTYNKASVVAYRNRSRVGVLVWWKAFFLMCKIMVVDSYFQILTIGTYIVVLFRGGLLHHILSSSPLTLRWSMVDPNVVGVEEHASQLHQPALL